MVSKVLVVVEKSDSGRSRQECEIKSRLRCSEVEAAGVRQSLGSYERKPCPVRSEFVGSGCLLSVVQRIASVTESNAGPGAMRCEEEAAAQ